MRTMKCDESGGESERVEERKGRESRGADEMNKVAKGQPE